MITNSHNYFYLPCAKVYLWRNEMKNLEIGKRIRTLRTEKGLSREAFCGDEKELTVRQLGRIEFVNLFMEMKKRFVNARLSLKKFKNVFMTNCLRMNKYQLRFYKLLMMYMFPKTLNLGKV